MRATACWLIVAVTISSWVALSNHCTLSAVAAKSLPSQTGCPFHSKPAKAPTKSASTECCKVLRALVAAATKQITPGIVDLADRDRDCLQIQIFPAEICFVTTTFDTGPPGKTAFVELNSSIRAHAPPFLA